MEPSGGGLGASRNHAGGDLGPTWAILRHLGGHLGLSRAILEPYLAILDALTPRGGAVQTPRERGGKPLPEWEEGGWKIELAKPHMRALRAAPLSTCDCSSIVLGAHYIAHRPPLIFDCLITRKSLAFTTCVGSFASCVPPMLSTLRSLYSWLARLAFHILCPPPRYPRFSNTVSLTCLPTRILYVPSCFS